MEPCSDTPSFSLNIQSTRAAGRSRGLKGPPQVEIDDLGEHFRSQCVLAEREHHWNIGFKLCWPTLSEFTGCMIVRDGAKLRR